MQDEAASRARSNPREAAHWGKMQERSLRRALLWRPKQRRLVLKGVRVAQTGHRSDVARGPVPIANALKEYWQP
eukprot:7173540-Pyramimonas_sp.AAC.1